MKFAIVALAAAAAVSAELVFDEATGTFKCLGDAAGKNFCAGGSLTSNIIIRCSGEKGQPGNCNNNLAGVPPVGVKTSALCWQTSDTSGDAGCSFQGIVHADDGSTFPIPGYSSSSSSAPEPTYGASTTAPGPTYGETTSSAPEPTYGVTTETSSSYYPTLSWSNTTTTYYPPPTYTAPTSTLITVTGTTTVTTCDTTTSKPAPTSYAPPPPTNQTSYTSSLPTPTLTPNGAGALLAKDSLVLGVVALIGFMFL